MENPNQEQNQFKHLRRLKPIREDRTPLFKFRNILNIIFMILAVVGVCFYLFSHMKTFAIILMLAAVAVKFIEVLLRLFHK
ncbi:MAG: mechanosensitive ion channel protein MscS [Prevotella sp.]|uniref:Mechanosensitive ion channel protein MscS n=1 Tax=Segatella cerevisiae TaxID=2053716 RepID=A0ABT1BUA2_9BACT|nr:mechanosensitive ion channel protein MscS [Segatella cerevisiae]MCI1246622.1 mechanosensitive ion channel protein MscS [Prevotella sp.]MCO6024669.1 mechanosensitive ion channel protein MscS [Segatella cerevisiae]